MTKQEIQAEALSKAVGGQSKMNYSAIYMEFIARGIPADDIQPRVNIFTYNAWKALGRQVKRGEHGVQIVTWIPTTDIDKDASGNEVVKQGKRPRTTTVFHISQTDAVN